eukprot:6199305-Pleurochrysis_carterae.AAC.1
MSLESYCKNVPTGYLDGTLEMPDHIAWLNWLVVILIVKYHVGGGRLNSGRIGMGAECTSWQEAGLLPLCLLAKATKHCRKADAGMKLSQQPAALGGTPTLAELPSLAHAIWLLQLISPRFAGVTNYGPNYLLALAEKQDWRLFKRDHVRLDRNLFKVLRSQPRVRFQLAGRENGDLRREQALFSRWSTS